MSKVLNGPKSRSRILRIAAIYTPAFSISPESTTKNSSIDTTGLTAA